MLRLMWPSYNHIVVSQIVRELLLTLKVFTLYMLVTRRRFWRLVARWSFSHSISFFWSHYNWLPYGEKFSGLNVHYTESSIYQVWTNFDSWLLRAGLSVGSYHRLRSPLFGIQGYKGICNNETKLRLGYFSLSKPSSGQWKGEGLCQEILFLHNMQSYNKIFLV